MKSLVKSLWKYFIFACVPFAVLLAAGWVLHRNNPASILSEAFLRPVGAAVFLSSVLLNVALPIFLRVRFHNAAIANPPLKAEDYLIHQKRQAAVIGAGGAAAGMACVFVLSNLFLYGSVLCALYGLYSILPSEKKNAGELKAYGCVFSERE